MIINLVFTLMLLLGTTRIVVADSNGSSCGEYGALVSIKVELKTDDYPSETSWEVKNNVTDGTIMEGGGYTSSLNIYTDDVSVCSNSCFQFVIRDSYGDGLFSEGYYKVFYDGELFEEGRGGGSFSERSSALFGGSCPSNPPSSYPSYPSYPSFTPSIAPPIDPPAECEDGGQLMRIAVEIKTDNYPEETSWFIKNSLTADILMEGGPYSVDQYTIHTELVPTCASNQCLQFTINDSASDGLDSGGYYKVFVNDELFEEGHGNFRERSSALFGGSCPSNPPSSYPSFTPSIASSYHKLLPFLICLGILGPILFIGFLMKCGCVTTERDGNGRLYILFHRRSARESNESSSTRPVVLDNNGDENVADERLSTAEQRYKIEQKLIIRRVLAATNSARSMVEQDTTSLDHTNKAYVPIIPQYTSSNRSIQLSERYNGLKDIPATNEIDEHIKSGQFLCNTNASKIQSRPKASSFARYISRSFRPNKKSNECCEICLMDYEVGDEVAFSPNEECTHWFHTSCIIDWLLENESCPICRRDYLKDDAGDEDMPSQTSTFRMVQQWRRDDPTEEEYTINGVSPNAPPLEV